MNTTQKESNTFIIYCVEAIYLVMIILICNLIAIGFLSNFTFDLYHQGRYSEAFYNMWLKIISGDIGIDRSVLAGETFIINGKTVAYFLPFPALVRGFFSLIYIGQYPLPSFLLGISLYVISVYFLFKEILQLYSIKNIFNILSAWFPLFVIPIITLFIESSIYWEAIIWGLSLFLLECLFFIKYLKNQKNTLNIYILFFIASLSLFTRPTYAFASGVMLILYSVNEFKHKRITVKNIPAIIIFLSALIMLGVLNYQKWGSAFEFSPLKYHEQLIGTERGRLAELSPSISYKRIPEAVEYYFMIGNDNFIHKSPFIKPGNKILPFSLEHFDYKEWYFSITLTMPIFLILSLFGIVNVFQKSPITKFKLIPIIVLAFVPCLLALMLISMALRYKAEFYSFILITSMIGLCSILVKFEKIEIIKMISAPVLILSVFFIINSTLLERHLFFQCKNINPIFICNWYENNK